MVCKIRNKSTEYNTAKGELEKLTKRHVIVLWGAKKDVGRNNSSIAKETNHISFTAMSVTHTHTRFRYTVYSCVHNEVKVFNRKLQKQMMDFDNTL